MNHAIHALVVCGALLAFAGCRATEPALYDEGTHIGSLAPAPYRILLMPFAGDRALRSDSTRIEFACADEAQLLERIVDDLRALNTASRVVHRGEMAANELATDFDLVITPSITQSAEFGYAKTAGGRSWLAGGLWILTWIGALTVEDSRYDASFAVRYAIANAQQGEEIATVDASSDRVDLTFFDRNRLLHLHFLSTLVLPPQWTADNDAVSSRTITQRVITRMAAELTRALKSDFAGIEAGDHARLVMDPASANGTGVASTLTVKGRLESPGSIEDVALYHNGERRDHRFGAVDEAPDGASTLRFSILVEDLVPGANYLQIRWRTRPATPSGEALGARRHSRTLVFHRES